MLAKLDKYNRFNCEVEVAILKTGASFGELALINDEPRKASIQCLSKCHFAVLDKDDYKRLINKMVTKQLNQKAAFFCTIPYFKRFSHYQCKRSIVSAYLPHAYQLNNIVFQ